MHKLLVPFDSSESAKRALAYAIRLARENAPMELVIVHAEESPRLYGDVALYVSEATALKALQERAAEVLRPAEEMARQAGVTFATRTRVGDIASAIVDCADEMSCDAIVMGTRGMSAIGNLMLGSVATKVIHLAKVPVTLVK